MIEHDPVIKTLNAVIERMGEEREKLRCDYAHLELDYARLQTKFTALERDYHLTNDLLLEEIKALRARLSE